MTDPWCRGTRQPTSNKGAGRISGRLAVVKDETEDLSRTDLWHDGATRHRRPSGRRRTTILLRDRDADNRALRRGRSPCRTSIEFWRTTGTKALHHFLPELLPPMDRRYTDGFCLGAKGTFNFNNLAFQSDPAGAFAEIFPRMARVARQCHRAFTDRIGRGMHTSLPKCVDNAIVGYVLLERGVAAAELLSG
jgi:hypothetical protein